MKTLWPLDLLDDPLSTSYTDIVSYLQGKVPSLYFDNAAQKFLWMRNRAGENGPVLYLNEMATSYDMISNIPVATTFAEQNKVNLTFFNNDFTDEYRVIIEGMTNDGRLTHIEKIVK